MARVGTEVHSFTCTCRACRRALSGHLVQCRKCNFRVHGECTTDGLCTLCSAACASSGSATVRKPRKFNPRWLLSRPWLRYDPVCVLMWCEACRTHPQIGCSVPFVQGTSIFKLFSLKEHGKSGTHCVSLALWKTGCRVSSVIRTLPTEVQDGIMGLFRTVYRLVQSYEPMTNLEGNSELVALNGGHNLPSYRSRVSGAEILRFIVHPLRASQGAIVTECEFFAIASDSCTDRSSKKEELFYARTVVDARMVTNFFSCQPLPAGNANGIVTALKRSMAAAGVDLETWLPKIFFHCGDGASVVQGEHGGVVAILGELQQQLTGYNVIVPYHASCHRCDLAFKAAMQLDHAFLDLLADTLQSAASFWNNAASRLKTLQTVAQSLEAAALKLGVLHTLATSRK